MRQLLKRLVLKFFGKEIRSFFDRLAPERILENPYVSAKRLLPLEGNQGFYIIPNFNGRSGEMPVPPAELRDTGGTSEEYLSSGREHVNSMFKILEKAGAPDLGRVLDFGCSTGRMLRHFPLKGELWGVDIRAQAIDWSQQNLEQLRFATITTYPHLPFEDNYFDLVYAGSVFTHIADLPDAWFLELKRITRVGGYIYITVHDRHSIELLKTSYKDHKDLQWFRPVFDRFTSQTGVLENDWGCFSFEGGKWGGFPVPQVFHDVEYLTRKWGAFAKLVSVNEEAYGWQTALLFQKT